jgi:hypothetical protein
MVATHQGQVDAEEFAIQVTLRLTFTADDLPAFQAALAEITSGQVTVESLPA